MRSRIRFIRKELGLNQRELAEMASVSRQTMSGLEKGTYNPSLKLAYKITLILGFKYIHEVFILEKEKSILNSKDKSCKKSK